MGSRVSPLESVETRVPFTYVAGHFIAVPVRINDSLQTQFVFDTGIGLNTISKALCDKLGCEMTGSNYKGKRMSGQEVSVPLTKISALSLGSLRNENLSVGVFDLSRAPLELANIGGFVSLKFFENTPFTLNYESNEIQIEDGRSMMLARKEGIEVPLTEERDETSLDIYLRLSLPNGRPITVEVDTGSDMLILNSRFMHELGVRPDADNVRKKEGKDETGNNYTRYFTRIHGPIRLTDGPDIVHTDPEVMFQNIIYDGLIGDSFLKSYNVTFDLARSKIVFSKPKLHAGSGKV